MLEHEGKFWITVDEAARFEKITRREVYNRLKPADPHYLISRDRSELLGDGTRGSVRYRQTVRTSGLGARKKGGKAGRLIDPLKMTFDAQLRWREELLKNSRRLTVDSRQSLPHSPDEARPQRTRTNPPQEKPSAAAVAQKEMFAITPLEAALRRLPRPDQRRVAFDRYNMVQPMLDHDFKAIGRRSLTGLAGAIAIANKVSVNTIWRHYNKLKATITPEDPEGDPCVLANERPGPEVVGPGAAVLDPSMCAFIKICWETEKLTRRQCYNKLIGYLEDKQRGCGAAHAYEFPSSTTVQRFINKRLQGDRNPWRLGPEGIKVAAGHILRAHDGLAGDAWCIDEWELDGVFYDERKHRQLINYGKSNPIAHLVSIIDERTTCILGWVLTIALSSEVVLDLVEQTLTRYWRPLEFVSDRGGHFRKNVLGRVVVEQNGELIEKLTGPLGALQIRPRQPREKNPRGNPIERMHRIYADKARQDFGVSWRGANIDERKRLTDIDERVKRHLHEHCKLGELGPQILSIQQAQQIIGKWVEDINLADTETDGCRGMTRLAAFRQFQPPAQIVEQRKVDDALLTKAFAQYFEDRTIEPGGLIKLPDGKHYRNPVLDAERGTMRTVARARHDDSAIIVIPDGKGEEPILARRVIPVGTGDHDALAIAYANQQRTRKILSQFAVEREAPPAPGHPEISNMEYLMSGKRHARPAPEPAAETVEAGPAAEPEPSLYEIRDLSVEEM
jgi:transposase InsO family protein